MSSGGQPARVQRDLEKALQRFRLAWQEPVGNDKIRPYSNALCNAAEHAITELERLRRIAAHVPGRIYIQAKENAGFGAAVRAAHNRPGGHT